MKKQSKTQKQLHSIWMDCERWQKIQNVAKKIPLSASKLIWELFRQYHINFLENNKIDTKFLNDENI